MLETIIQATRILTAGGVLIMPFLGTSFNTELTCRRDVRCCIGLLSTLALITVVELVVTTIRAGGKPGILFMFATTLYINAVYVHIHTLWPGPRQLSRASPRVWALGVVFEIPTVVGFSYMHTQSFDLIVAGVAAGLRFCSIIALAAVFAWPDRGGRIRLNDEGSRETYRGKGFSQLATVADSIRTAGGYRKWMKRFHVFRGFMLPMDQPWMWWCIASALVLLLCDTLLDLTIPYFHQDFYDRFVEDVTRGTRLSWAAMIRLAVLNTITSWCGISSVQSLLWQKFDVEREKRTLETIYGRLMLHEAAFHDSHTRTQITSAIASGNGICDAFDYILLSTLPNVITFIGVGTALITAYGIRVALIIWIITSTVVLTDRLKQLSLMGLRDSARNAGVEVDRQEQATLGAWFYVSITGQIDRNVKTYKECLEKRQSLQYELALARFSFTILMSVVFLSSELSSQSFIIEQIIRLRQTPGELAAFVGLSSRLQQSLHFFTGIADKLLDAASKANSLQEVLNYPNKMKYGNETLNAPEGHIEFQDVTFGFPKSHCEILKKQTFVMEKGQTTALVGSRGVGKTSILKVIARMYDTTEGSVRIDGKDVREYQKGQLSKHITWMTQSTHIFEGTIADNIRFGTPEATDDAVRNAAKLAGIHPDIMMMEKQYNTMVKEGTDQLSGGQKQLIGLAAAILRDTQIIFLDEPTANLDPRAEAIVKRVLDTTFANRTKVIIAHRLPTIKDAQKIICFRKAPDGSGEVAEQGTHSELMAQDGLFADLWKTFQDDGPMRLADTHDEAVEPVKKGLFTN